jgi:addiction module HigA family antidote
MVRKTEAYRPDYAVPPGALLREWLQTHEISPEDLARRSGLTVHSIDEILAGRGTIGPDVAIKLQRSLGVDASVWLAMEANYRLHETTE